MGTSGCGLAGIDAAIAAGLGVKINAVAIRGAFEAEVDDLISSPISVERTTLIQEKPLCEAGRDRSAASGLRQPSPCTWLKMDARANRTSQRWAGALYACCRNG